MKLLAGTEEVQDLPIEDILPSMEWRPGVCIAAACILDPYALLHFSDGSAILLSGDSEEGQDFADLRHFSKIQPLNCCALCASGCTCGSLVVRSSVTHGRGQQSRVDQCQMVCAADKQLLRPVYRGFPQAGQDMVADFNAHSWCLHVMTSVCQA